MGCNHPQVWWQPLLLDLVHPISVLERVNHYLYGIKSPESLTILLNHPLLLLKIQYGGTTCNSYMCKYDYYVQYVFSNGGKQIITQSSAIVWKHTTLRDIIGIMTNIHICYPYMLHLMMATPRDRCSCTLSLYNCQTRILSKLGWSIYRLGIPKVVITYYWNWFPPIPNHVKSQF